MLQKLPTLSFLIAKRLKTHFGLANLQFASKFDAPHCKRLLAGKFLRQQQKMSCLILRIRERVEDGH